MTKTTILNTPPHKWRNGYTLPTKASIILAVLLLWDFSVALVQYHTTAAEGYCNYSFVLKRHLSSCFHYCHGSGLGKMDFLFCSHICFQRRQQEIDDLYSFPWMPDPSIMAVRVITNGVYTVESDPHKVHRALWQEKILNTRITYMQRVLNINIFLHIKLCKRQLTTESSVHTQMLKASKQNFQHSWENNTCQMA